MARHYGVATDRYKLMYFYNLDEWELYDLEKDPKEMKSVYGDAAYADVTAQLKQELQRLREELKVPEDTHPLQPRRPANRPRQPQNQRASQQNQS